jgi:hypothetical protein
MASMEPPLILFANLGIVSPDRKVSIYEEKKDWTRQYREVIRLTIVSAP